MTNPSIAAAPGQSTRVTGWDRLAIALLAAAGFVLSYDALRQMAAAIHVRAQLTYLFPLIVDGFIAYGVRALVVLRDARWPARLYVWALFGCATATSVWANALHAVRLNQLTSFGNELRLSDAVVGALSTLAPLALGGAVHLYILVARHGQNSDPRRAESRAGDSAESERLRETADRTDEMALLTLTSAAGLLPTEWSDAVPGLLPAGVDDQPTEVPDTLSDGCAEAPGAADESGVEDSAAAVQGKAIGRPPGASMDELMEIGRAAVAARGRLTRAVVEQAVREAGLSLGSTRLTEVMKRLRQERNDDPGGHDNTAP